jgi:hypothetical protein
MSENEHLHAVVGRSVEIRLPCTPGSGAIWYLVTILDGLSVEQKDASPIGQGIGGAALQVFVVTAKSTGAHVLDFELKRIWENVVRQRHRAILEVST